MHGFWHEYLLAHLQGHPRALSLYINLLERWYRIRYPKLFPKSKLSAFCIPNYPEALIEKTKEVWAKRLGRPVSYEEALSIIRAFGNFFILLREVKRAK